jgi:hypothetical protein
VYFPDVLLLVAQGLVLAVNVQYCNVGLSEAPSVPIIGFRTNFIRESATQSFALELPNAVTCSPPSTEAHLIGAVVLNRYNLGGPLYLSCHGRETAV